MAGAGRLEELSDTNRIVQPYIAQGYLRDTQSRHEFRKVSHRSMLAIRFCVTITAGTVHPKDL